MGGSAKNSDYRKPGLLAIMAAMSLPFPATGLPIEAILSRLSADLEASGAAVLQAEPGAGKTTLVPPGLYREPWLRGQKILMLQPRRIAARSSAERMASLLGEPVGRTVGYRVALESRVSAATRIEVLTEGILSRMLAIQPDLPGVGLVIFDEFHERSQHADLALALALESRDALRPDLRLLVMSATIDTVALARLVARDATIPAPVIDCPGQTFPVAVDWRPAKPGPDGRAVDFWNNSRAFLALVAERVTQALDECAGDILVFLPGQGEIRRVAESIPPRNGLRVLALHGSLSTAQQSEVLAPGNGRRVILATNVAETSLTIPGIDVVIDSGLVRVNRFDSRLGMDRLVTERLSLASSRQRQGRAGRTAAGSCWKLWPESERLDAWLPPEIERADLADFALAAFAWGCSGPGELRLLTPPAPPLWQQAVQLLTSLGAFDTSGSAGPVQLSPLGRQLAGLGLHPRLACMVAKARPEMQKLAWASAILLGERDILVSADSADFRLRLGALLGQGQCRETNQALLQRAREALEQRSKGPSASVSATDEAGALLALAWPDRVGLLESVSPDRRNQLVARYQLTNGRQAILTGSDVQHAPAVLVAVDAEAGDEATVIRLFAPIICQDPQADLAKLLPELVSLGLEIQWDNWRPRVSQQRRIDQLVLESKAIPAGQVDRPSLLIGLGRQIRRAGMAALPWSPTARAVLARCRWAYQHQAQLWPDCSDEALSDTLENWLLPHANSSGGPALDEAIMDQAFGSLLDWNVRSRLDKELPTHWQVPSGSRRPLQYPDAWTGDQAAAPILAVRIQEIFGMEKQPVILGTPVLLHLLSPAQKPLQVTADLTSFWSRTYPEIRKEMRGRYPRHYWPDNPLEAEPTARAKPRGT